MIIKNFVINTDQLKAQPDGLQQFFISRVS